MKMSILGLLFNMFKVLILLVGPVLLYLLSYFGGYYVLWRDIIVFLFTSISAIVLYFRLFCQPIHNVCFSFRSAASFVLGTCVAIWIFSGLLDLVFMPEPLPLRGRVAAPEGMPLDRSKLRVGLALSGGGYRAALVHAGVLQELSARGIPVTNISSVSGGSIIGAFVASGGEPSDFVSAVKVGRFRFVRELFSFYNFPRWFSPVGSFTRREVQSNIVRRVLLGNNVSQFAEKPNLMIATTDLNNSISIGITNDGYMIAGPTTFRHFNYGTGMVIDNLGDLSSKVALSGSFPGVFPALETNLRYTLSNLPLSSSKDIRSLSLSIVDGGVRDNLGLNLLVAIDKETRGAGNNSLSWPVFKPSTDWALDMIIISDGGQSLDKIDAPMSLFGQINRSIELSGLSTGILRYVENSPELPIVPLSIYSQLALSLDAQIVELPGRKSTSARRAFFKPQLFNHADLERIVDISPNKSAAMHLLIKYRDTKSDHLNLSLIDTHCNDGSIIADTLPECNWQKLVDVVLDDIDTVIGTFRRSATLQDNYTSVDADALVRLGRYFVLFRGMEIDRTIQMATARNKN